MAADSISPLETAIEKRLDTTSRLVRNVEIAFSLLIVFSLLIGGLFLAILADHWISGGLSMPLRLGAFFILCGTIGLYIHQRIVPLFRYQINPVYTANLIEKETSAFQNSLINWLLLRQERSEHPGKPADKIQERMYNGIVQTAAVNVQTVPAEHPVDFRSLVRACTLFVILLALFAGYGMFSPKSPFASLARVLIPFSPIEPPQAAQFNNVQPGNTSALQGEMLIISSEVVSRISEPVYLVFSTDDGQAVAQKIPMSKPAGKNTFEARFPPGKQGFVSGVNYWLAQGESRSATYRIDVLPTASIEVLSIRYKFPEYTGLISETVEHTGDVRALEGTEVSVAVRSTLPLQKIDLVFDDHPAGKISMAITGGQKTEAKGTFTLKIPSPKTFAFVATDINGNESRRSGIYQIESIADEPPKVQWADTAAHLKEDQIDLPLNAALPLPIQAEDPDFALRYLSFKVESTRNKSADKQIRIPDVKLLESPSSGPTEHIGQVFKEINFKPEAIRLKAGDSVEVWAEAKDTKYPNANSGESVKLTINITEPLQRDKEKQNVPGEEKERDGQDGNSEQSGEQPPNEKQQNEQQDGKQNDKENPPGQEEQQNKEGEENENQEDKQDSKENSPEQKEQQNKGDQKSGNSPTGAGEQPPGKQNQSDQQQGNASGQQESKDGEEGTNQGPAGDETSDEEGKSKETQQGEVSNGKESNEQAEGPANGSQQTDSDKGTANNDPADTSKNTDSKQSPQQNPGEKNSPENSQENSPETPVNPETQDGDAMERIVEQMKKENKFEEGKPATPSQNAEKESGTPQNSGSQNPGRGNTQAKEDATQFNTPVSGLNDQLQSGAKPADNQGPVDSKGETAAGQDSAEQNSAIQESAANGQGEAENGGEPENAASNKQEPAAASPNQSAPGNEKQSASEGKSAMEGTPASQPPELSPPGTGGGVGTETKTTVDDPNLEYADKVTNLVLKYLEDQLKEKPSDELLKKLGWSEEQLRRFYEKWQKMSMENKSKTEPAGKSPWEEALKSLGLSPNRNRTALQKSSATSKDKGRVIESQRFDPPPGLREQYKRYTEGIAR